MRTREESQLSVNAGKQLGGRGELRNAGVQRMGRLNQASELRKQMEQEEHSKGREHLDKDLETCRVECAQGQLGGGCRSNGRGLKGRS